MLQPITSQKGPVLLYLANLGFRDKGICSIPTLKGIKHMPSELHYISASTHTGHDPKVIVGKCSQLHPTFSISKLKFRSPFLLLLHAGYFSALLLFADLQHCPITVSSCKLSIFAIRRAHTFVLIAISCSVHIVQTCLVVCSLNSSNTTSFISQPGPVFL